MRSAHYSRAMHAGLALSFAIGGAWAAFHAFQAPASPAEVTLDIGELRARSAELVGLFDARASDTLTQLYLRAQQEQWAHAVRRVNENLVSAMDHDAGAARAHEAAVELLRIGEALPGTGADAAARDAAARVTDALLAAERARAP